MTGVVFRPEAENDLTAIALHVAKYSATRALLLVERLRTRCAILDAHPQAGRPRPELGAEMRSLSERPYVIIYRIHQDQAEITAILHGARDLPAALSSRLLADR